ncbi:MAG: hypothetical protein QOK91_10895 [Nitrososphaeraceae archaeon]|nr:hypothetical protein [Nitrososphaeraceae archaeon]MDW0192347.1 hypothetical protein [Nitrososphaeraceae archaeon]MDW0217018.1 hypothetical protein [Nitrososphaeraceae archaeon]
MNYVSTVPTCVDFHQNICHATANVLKNFVNTAQKYAKTVQQNVKSMTWNIVKNVLKSAESVPRFVEK